MIRERTNKRRITGTPKAGLRFRVIAQAIINGKYVFSNNIYSYVKIKIGNNANINKGKISLCCDMEYEHKAYASEKT